MLSKKQGIIFSQNLTDRADCACRAACLLERIMENFEPETLPEYLKKMHEIEHSADIKKQELSKILIKAFISTPVKTAIINISNDIDELTDEIEDVLIRIYYNRIKNIRRDSLELVKTVILTSEEIKKMMSEISDMKNAKSMNKHIVKINSLEEKADELFISCMFDLHGSGRNYLDIAAWSEIYIYLEKCEDTAKKIANSVSAEILKNA